MDFMCSNCVSLDNSNSGFWRGWPICHECNRHGFHLADEQFERAEKAERERDEARAQAVWALHISGGWQAMVAGVDGDGTRHLGCDRKWHKFEPNTYPAASFPTRGEAVFEGRRFPWWSSNSEAGSPSHLEKVASLESELERLRPLAVKVRQDEYGNWVVFDPEGRALVERQGRFVWDPQTSLAEEFCSEEQASEVAAATPWWLNESEVVS